jgi:hypothetical protein
MINIRVQMLKAVVIRTKTDRAAGFRGVDVGQENGEEVFPGVIQEAQRQRIQEAAHLPAGVNHFELYHGRLAHRERIGH